MEHRIAVTGSTGTVGGSVARILSAGGLPLVLPVRSPDRASHLPASLVRQASYANVDTAVASLAGVEALFMLSTSEEADRVATHCSFLDAASEAGVGHIVYTSFLGAAPDATFLLARDHYGAPGWQVEAWVSTYTAIARGGLAELSPDVERLTGRRPISLRDLLTATG